MRSNWTGEILRTALRVFGYQIMFGFFGLMITPSLISLDSAVRIPLISVLIAVAGFLMFMDGAYRGQRDCKMGDTIKKLARAGTYTPTNAENAKRYSRLKGILSPCAGALPVLLIAVFVSVTAKPFVYTLQDLPAWLSSYSGRGEIGAPLQYLQNIQITATATDYLRIVTRFVLFLFVGLFGTLGDASSLLFDRLSPLLTLILPSLAIVGYQFGPMYHKREVKAIEEAKRKPRKRLKKNVRKKAEPGEKKQLI